MELLTKLILMLQRATLHNIKSYLICPLRGKGSRLLFERARFAGTGQTWWVHAKVISPGIR